MEQAAFGVQKL